MSILLGTGAAEGIPASYCECKACQNARNSKGKDIRSRSCFYIDENNLVDYGPDLYMQCVNSEINLRKIKNVFLTHFHEDHINASEFSMRMSGNPSECDLQLYGSKSALKMVNKIFKIFKDHTRINSRNYYKNIKLNILKPYTDYELDTIKVTPILSSHPGYGFKEWGYNYIFTDKSKKTFLYAVDTGWYTEKTWNFLSNLNYSFDYVVMECTYGDYEMADYQPEHLDFKNVYYMLDKMKKIKLITNTTPIYLTHICHLHSLNHQDTQKLLNESGWNIILGYDGMTI